ncbi:MAG TPA: hypothetical protein DEP84_25305 [Chloroflexi bacterium]|nr:hypothetical protein [Chloroflexota bacterium]
MTAEELQIRPARPQDKAAVVEFTKNIWEGSDYLPKVWDAWLADPRGRLYVGEVAGTPVATGRVVLLSPSQAWLEGLRVDPDYQGRGYARAMHDFTVSAALEIPGVERVGLATSWENEAVHHMSLASGMHRVGDFHYTVAPAAANETPAPDVFGPEDFAAVRALVAASECARLAQGHMANGWRFPVLTDALLAQLLSEGQVVGYDRAGQPVVLALLGQNKERADVWVGFLAGSDHTAIRDLGWALRRRAVGLPDTRVRAMLPATLSGYAAFNEAGFGDPDDGEFHVYVFERER